MTSWEDVVSMRGCDASVMCEISALLVADQGSNMDV
jgi:hypothetical protein